MGSAGQTRSRRASRRTALRGPASQRAPSAAPATGERLSRIGGPNATTATGLCAGRRRGTWPCCRSRETRPRA
eukprot:694191-Pyramimonas_sp.AAC.1